jgi:deoxyribodipyrimidine photo-lyase
MNSPPVSVFWFRRDLRIDDNHGLFHALKDAGSNLIPIFIFDKNILSELPHNDHRVSFIHETVSALKDELREYALDLRILRGRPTEIFNILIAKHNISKVFCNEDYEPYALERDAQVAKLLRRANVEFKSFKDHVIFAKDEVIKDDGSCYRMFTPYSRKWFQLYREREVDFFASQQILTIGTPRRATPMPALKDLGFKRSELTIPAAKLTPAFLKAYAKSRDYPGLQGTTHIGPHLRFGTISIRKAVKLARKYSPIWLNELIWREFFQQILFHYPRTVDEPYDQRFQKFPWRSLQTKKAREDFEAWKTGRTGYLIVDAGMREINATGFMHNRARMIVGSFLTKHLLLNWQLGERYFAGKLFDFELASNVGNWQWVAGTGCDAAPYFRVFNPALQAKKFDSDGLYIKKWVPEVGSKDYPQPIVDHESARRRALKAFAQVKGRAK